MGFGVLRVTAAGAVDTSGVEGVDPDLVIRPFGWKGNHALGGYPVWIFSDLKRHDMGRENASRYQHRGVPEQLYITRRLKDLAGSSPYFYDGRAPWLDAAIIAHGGEAEPARDDFMAASAADKGALRVFLLSLQREPRVMVP